jgi:hypothetical protein
MKTAAETHNMLCEAYSDDALSQTMTYKWSKRFKNRRTSMDDEHSGWTSRSELLIARMKTIIHGNCRLSEKLQKRLKYPLVHAIQF